MSGELKTSYIPGQTLYFIVRTNTGTVWNGATFEAYTAGNFANYDIAAVEQGTSGFYIGTMPVVTAGVYSVEARVQAGGSPAQSDLSLGSGDIEWNGTVESYLYGNSQLAAAGLNNISAADPGVVATTWAQMVVQTWRRLFKKSDLTTTALKTYADNGTSVVTTQVVSEAAGTKTQNAAT